MSDQVVHIAIDVSFDDDQIQGQVSDGSRQPTPFSGWLGLIGLLDGMLVDPRPHGAPGPDSPRTRLRQNAGLLDGREAKAGNP